jgi:hypothetical protein
MQPSRTVNRWRLSVRDAVWAILLVGVVVARFGEASQKDESLQALQRELNRTKEQVVVRSKELIAIEEWTRTSETQIVELLSRLPYEQLEDMFSAEQKRLNTRSVYRPDGSSSKEDRDRWTVQILARALWTNEFGD